MLGTLNLGLEWMFLAHGSLFLWPWNTVVTGFRWQFFNLVFHTASDVSSFCSPAIPHHRLVL